MWITQIISQTILKRPGLFHTWLNLAPDHVWITHIISQTILECPGLFHTWPNLAPDHILTPEQFPRPLLNVLLMSWVITNTTPFWSRAYIDLMGNIPDHIWMLEYCSQGTILLLTMSLYHSSLLFSFSRDDLWNLVEYIQQSGASL
jgi:hypothetical protein